LFVLAVVFSILLITIGLGFIYMYFWDGVVSRLGDPDQSLAFWYLPILFIGFFCFSGGVTLLVVAYKKRRR